MINKVENLVVALTALAKEATVYLQRANGKPYQPELPLKAADGPDCETETMTPNPAPAAPVAPKKAKKAKAPASEAPTTPAQQKEEAPEDFSQLTDDLVLKTAFDATVAFMKLTANEEPTGQQYLITQKLPKFNVSTMANFTRAQALEWLAMLKEETSKRNGAVNGSINGGK